jgi:uncharacterized membrane protein YeaQ/YmgE (transglycosylase-associated protein family)
MGLIVWILAGLLVAWLTYTFWPKSAMGTLPNFAVATVGGVLGGFLSTFLYPTLNPLYNITGESFMTSVVVSLVLLVSFRVISTRVLASRKKSMDIQEKGVIP